MKKGAAKKVQDMAKHIHRKKRKRIQSKSDRKNLKQTTPPWETVG